MNPVNFESLLKQFAAASQHSAYTVRLSLSNGDIIDGEVAPQAPGQQGLPRMISLRSPSGQVHGVEIADIVRITGPFLQTAAPNDGVPRPVFQALESMRGGYWYVDKRDPDGGTTVVGGPDAPLERATAEIIANALNEAVDDYAALLALSGYTAQAS